MSLPAWAGAVLLLLSAIIHLHLWSQGYKHIPTIGPLFVLQGVVGIVAALAVAVFRRFVVLAGAAMFAIATAGGLVLSILVGLFGFRESIHAPYATSSLTIEVAAFVLLATAASVTLARRRDNSVDRGPRVPS